MTVDTPEVLATFDKAEEEPCLAYQCLPFPIRDYTKYPGNTSNCTSVCRVSRRILFAAVFFFFLFFFFSSGSLSCYAGWSVRSDVVQILQRILRRAQAGARVGEFGRVWVGQF